MQERNLFLFNDLLLIAKERSSSHFKLKDQVSKTQVSGFCNCALAFSRTPPPTKLHPVSQLQNCKNLFCGAFTILLLQAIVNIRYTIFSLIVPFHILLRYQKACHISCLMVKTKVSNKLFSLTQFFLCMIARGSHAHTQPLNMCTQFHFIFGKWNLNDQGNWT